MFERSLPWLIAFGLCIGAQADPMRPDTPSEPSVVQPVPQTTPEPSLRLTSIYIVDDQRTAVINGQWLSRNDTIHNYRVTDIQANHVHLRRGNRARTLTLNPSGSLSITETNEE